MADVAWVLLKMWPWDDAWLDVDSELCSAFTEVGLADLEHAEMGESFRYMLREAMNGRVDVEPHESGLFNVASIEGEMQGASYVIREESWILERLQERGIAYYLKGDSKYEWDGDEMFWHPGMEEPFCSACGESGRFLDESDFDRMEVECLPWPEKVARVEAFIADCAELIEQREAEDAARVRGGEKPVNEDVIRIWHEAIVRHGEERETLRRLRPEPSDLAALVRAHFAADPFAWVPGPDWAPKLKTEEIEA